MDVLPPRFAARGRKRRKYGRDLSESGGKSVEWSGDGFHAQGWLLFPSDYREGEKYPMVVSVHGGPGGVRKPAWPGNFFDLSVLAGKGYFVFFPNPRGSFGQGEAFTRANVKDFGGGDLRDILAG